MIARFGSSPMMIGNTNVAPNIATTCWAPSPIVLGQDSRSSGLTTSPGRQRSAVTEELPTEGHAPSWGSVPRDGPYRCRTPPRAPDE